jgi:hypothetical protein
VASVADREASVRAMQAAESDHVIAVLVIETAGGTPDTASVEPASRSWTPNSTSLCGY